MLKKPNLFLLILCAMSIILTATIELNDRTNVHYETSLDNVLNVQFQLGTISIDQIQKNNVLRHASYLPTFRMPTPKDMCCFRRNEIMWIRLTK